MQKIVPNLWFDSQAEEAAKFYISAFKNGRIIETTHYGKSAAEISGRKEGDIMTVTFEVDDMRMIGINGGPIFQFTEAVSLMVYRETQEEIDELWGALSADPNAEQCGWLKDKYGLSWQVVPTMMDEIMRSQESDKLERAMEAMLKMKKLDIAELLKAFEGK